MTQPSKKAGDSFEIMTNRENNFNGHVQNQLMNSVTGVGAGEMCKKKFFLGQVIHD